MNLKKEIENFRSQAFMSRYDTAIKLGRSILQQLSFLSNVFSQDFQQIQQQIKEEVNYCVEINKFMLISQMTNFCQSVQRQEEVKSVQRQEEVKTQENQKTFWGKKRKVEQLNSADQKNQKKNNELQTDQFSKIQQKLYKSLVLPLNMSIFKLKSSIILIITKNCQSQVLEYLLNNDFKQFASADLQDLGIQNISNLYEEMQNINETRGVVLIQKQILNPSYNQKQIKKLKSTIQAFKDMNKSRQKQQKRLLIFLVQQNNFFSQQNSYCVKNNSLKSINII